MAATFQFVDLIIVSNEGRFTDGPAINHPIYFLQSSCFPGGREMFFTSYRTGEAQLFETSLVSGETRQLTEDEGVAGDREQERVHAS